MDRIDGLGDESARKKTDIGRAQIERLGVAPAEIVLVGDMQADAELAQALGTRCILVPWGHNDTQRLKKTDMPVAHTPAELESMLLAMRG